MHIQEKNYLHETELSVIFLISLNCRLKYSLMTDEGCSAVTSALKFKPITPERAKPEYE